MRTWDLVFLIMRTWLSLAENPGSNRHREAIRSSQQSWDVSEKNEKTAFFPDFSIQYLSQLLIFKSRRSTNKRLYLRSSRGTGFFVDQALPRADSHFLVSSLSFYDFSAADNDALIWKCVHLESHKKWSRKATTSRKSGAYWKRLDQSIFEKKKIKNRNIQVVHVVHRHFFGQKKRKQELWLHRIKKRSMWDLNQRPMSPETVSPDLGDLNHSAASLGIRDQIFNNIYLIT